MKFVKIKYIIAVALILIICLSYSNRAENVNYYQTKSVNTEGGFGGKIIKVTNLNASGPGSFYEAVRSKGKRIVVFEVAGIIDLKKKLVTIRDPYLTVAGQTAPSPGITLINGGVLITAHDVIIQHLRIRPGNNGTKDVWSSDALSTKSAYNVIIDHCSFSWASDENLSASGPRFEGKSGNEWRNNTSHHITFSNNIIAEGLRNSTHRYGEHSKGTLIHDNVTNVLIKGNLYANNMDRNPYLKGGSSGVILNNYIFNPGKAAIRYNLAETEWALKTKQTGKWSIIGNVMEYGNDSENIAMVDIKSGPCEIYISDNIAFNLKGQAVPIISGDKSKVVKDRSMWFSDLTILGSNNVKSSVLSSVGARPWDRDVVDKRIVEGARGKSGRIIDNEKDVGGLPVIKEVKKAFNEKEWDFKGLYNR